MSLNDNLWELGTAPRGLDGDTARDAGEKYNNHKHPPILLADDNAFDDWIGSNSIKAGDTALLNGVIFMWDGNDAIPIGMGPGDVGENLISEICLGMNMIVEVAAPSWEEAGGDLIDPRQYNLARADRQIVFKVLAYMVGEDDASVGVIRLRNNTVAATVAEFNVATFNTPTAFISAPLLPADNLRNAADIYTVQVQVPAGKKIKLLKASLMLISELG